MTAAQHDGDASSRTGESAASDARTGSENASGSAREPGPAFGHFGRSLASRISLLVGLVVVVTFTWGFVALGQLRDLQAGFDRLVQVYVVFDKRLAEAHVQAVRIGEQVRTHQRGAKAGTTAPALDPALASNLRAALQTRAVGVSRAREPIDAALADPDRFGGEDELEQLRQIQASLDLLQPLVGTGTGDAVARVLDDVRAQGQIEQLFETMRAQSGRAIEELRDEVQQAQQRTERWTLGFAAVTLVIGVLAAIAVVVTLRPLRQLAANVRRLGGGDWSQRIAPEQAERHDEVGQLAAEFNQMAEALQERERRLLRGERLAAAGQLAAQITHEIRNPLSSVALNVELLDDEIRSDEGKQLLGRITAEIDRLTTITEGYLTFARRPKAELVEIDLRDEIRSLVEFIEPELDQDGVELHAALPAAPVRVMGDANQLRQALLNLIRNAKEAVLDEGQRATGRAGRIDVMLECKARAVTVVVADNGPGIGLVADKLDKIFEAFYTRKARGTGLGLPMVQQIVADHGGSVRVAATGPSGTRFEIELPAAVVAPPSRPSGSADGEASGDGEAESIA